MLPCYIINENFWQNQLFLVQRLVWVLFGCGDSTSNGS
jgi:hypothetical protein